MKKLFFITILALIAYHACAFETELSYDADGNVFLSYPALTNEYYKIYATHTLSSSAWSLIDMQLGEQPIQTWQDAAIITVEPRTFYRVQRIALATPEDNDEDGVDDVIELIRGSDPLDPSSTGTTLYANVTTGDNAYSGLSSIVTANHGPKENVYAAINLAYDQDRIEIAAGTYPEINTSRNITVILVPSGSVIVTPSG